jgi:hypothetical protein
MGATIESALASLVPLEEASVYLSPFQGTWSGYERQGNVKVSSVEIIADEGGTVIHVEARDPELGRYHLAFKRVVVTQDPAAAGEEPYLGDPESDEPDETIDDVATFMDADKVKARSDTRLKWLLKGGDWSVLDGFGRYYGTIRPLRGFPRGEYPGEEEREALSKQMLNDVERDGSVTLCLSSRNFMGYTTMEITAEELTIERLETDRVAGSCCGCGGTSFYLTCQAGIALETAEDGSLGISSAIRTAEDLVEAVSLRNVLVGVRCRSCGLEHPKSKMGGFTGVVRGLGWDGARRGISASAGRLGRLLDG